MKVFVSDWKPELKEVFTEKQLQVLDDLLMYAQYQFDIPYCDSVYESNAENLQEVHRLLKDSRYETIS